MLNFWKLKTKNKKITKLEQTVVKSKVIYIYLFICSMSLNKFKMIKLTKNTFFSGTFNMPILISLSMSDKFQTYGPIWGQKMQLFLNKFTSKSLIWFSKSQITFPFTLFSFINREKSGITSEMKMLSALWVLHKLHNNLLFKKGKKIQIGMNEMIYQLMY